MYRNSRYYDINFLSAALLKNNNDAARERYFALCGYLEYMYIQVPTTCIAPWSRRMVIMLFLHYFPAPTAL
jgi:hypothetical protein